MGVFALKQPFFDVFDVFFAGGAFEEGPDFCVFSSVCVRSCWFSAILLTACSKIFAPESYLFVPVFSLFLRLGTLKNVLTEALSTTHVPADRPPIPKVFRPLFFFGRFVFPLKLSFRDAVFDMCADIGTARKSLCLGKTVRTRKVFSKICLHWE